MDKDDPVQQAVTHLRAARAELMHQIRRVDQALAALGVADERGGSRSEPATSRNPSAPHAALAVADQTSVVEAVKTIMDAEPGPWRGPDLTRLILQDRHEQDRSPSAFAAVRTALRTLSDRGDVVRLDRGIYQSKAWVTPAPDNDGDPDKSGSPLHLSSDQEGGDHHAPVVNE